MPADVAVGKQKHSLAAPVPPALVVGDRLVVARPLAGQDLAARLNQRTREIQPGDQTALLKVAIIFVKGEDLRDQMSFLMNFTNIIIINKTNTYCINIWI